MAKYFTRRESFPLMGALVGSVLGCMSFGPKDNVVSSTKTPVLEHVLDIPSYSKDIVGRDLGEKVNQAADYPSKLDGNLSVYESLRRMYGIGEDLGKVMDRTIYPDARDGVSEKERASVQMMYEFLKGLDIPSDLFVNPSYGKDNLKPEHYAVLDLVNSGKHGISVGLREARLMLEKGDWSKDDFVRALKGYEPKDDYKGVLEFLKNTDWVMFNNDDWRKWKKSSREELVKYKKNLDILIQHNQIQRIVPFPDSRSHANSPEETRKYLIGDCEDLSVEAAPDMEFLGNIYEQVRILTAGWNEGIRKFGSHSVLSYRKKGDRGVYVMDNTHIRVSFRGIRKFNSYRGACEKIAEEYGYKLKRLYLYTWERFLQKHNKHGGLPHSESLI